MPLVTVRDGKWQADFHPGQKRAFLSEKRVVAIIAGGQSGKTSAAPLWLHREMQRKGPMDYLVAAPNFTVIDKQAGPELKLVFETVLKLGVMKQSPSWQFAFSEAGCKRLWGVAPPRPPRIILGHADDPESLEAMTVGAAWLDEAGQAKFKVGSWEAVNQRVAVNQGRILITTKPYNLGWLKRLVYDEWLKADKNHPDIDVVNFNSLMNPAFPRAEYERARRELPRWRFLMQYDGQFTRPAGVIYEAFDSALHCVPPFRIPDDWPRYAGVDFGAVNTAAVFLAERLERGARTGRYVAYREYHPARASAVKLPPEGHVAALRAGEPAGLEAVGGAASEDEARADFAAAGLWVAEPPVRDVEVGIDRTHALLQAGRLEVFSTLSGLIDELSTYSRELNEQGQPTEKIENKSEFHLLDALRYVCSRLYDGAADWTAPALGRGGVIASAPAGVFGPAPDRDAPPGIRERSF